MDKFGSVDRSALSRRTKDCERCELFCWTLQLNGQHLTSLLHFADDAEDGRRLIRPKETIPQFVSIILGRP